MSHELLVARQAAQAGGAVVASMYRQGIAVREKGTSDLVTDADIRSEQAVAATIQASFPDHAILGEEQHQGAVDAEHLWVVDPLDGTTNFAHGLPQFSVSVAYYRAGVPLAAAVLNPIRGELYSAARGEGAWLGDRRLEVGRQSRLNEVLIAVGFYYDRGAMMEATLLAIRDLFRRQIHGIRRFGSAALDICQVAAGQFGAFFEFELSPWDYAAGALILEEAGGRITDCLGAPLGLRRSSLLASNGLLHDEILRIVGEHLRGLAGQGRTGSHL